MKIIFTGLPYFGKKLVDDLNEFDKVNAYYFFNTYYSWWDKLKFVFHLLNADRVISINGASSNSGALNWVIRLKKKLILQWQGSDALTAISNFKNKTFNSKYIDYAKSFTDALWLKEELKEIGINVEILNFKHCETASNNIPFNSVNAVSYMIEGQEKFYGLDTINHLAENFPAISFHIIGSSGLNLAHPENVIFYGWVNKKKVKDLMNENAVFIRFPEHDGNSLSVLEAISNGNYVLWNQPHTQVKCVTNYDEVVQSFGDLIESVRANNLAKNIENLNWANAHLKRDAVLKSYIDTILQ